MRSSARRWSTEPVEPLALKGKSEPVPAFRLVSVLDAPERSHASRFVGRERELALIVEAWERAQARGALRAGDGRRRGRRRASRGWWRRRWRGRGARRPRPLPAVRGGDHLLAGGRGGEAARRVCPPIRPRRRRSGRCSARRTSGRARTRSPGRSASCSRSRRRWSCVFDDIQWGEETFLDLVESTALLSTGAPLLLLCMARPELVERRPSWPGRCGWSRCRRGRRTR